MLMLILVAALVASAAPRRTLAVAAPLPVLWLLAQVPAADVRTAALAAVGALGVVVLAAVADVTPTLRRIVT